MALGAAVGAIGTIVGAGGGFILVPALLLLEPRASPESVTATSLLVVWANATSGSLAYARQGRIDFRSGLWFAASAMPGAVAGALAVAWVPRRAFDLLFGALLLIVGGWMGVRRWHEGIREPVRGRWVVTRELRDREGNLFRYGYHFWKGIALSSAIGFLSSLLGIGGGIIHVPAMVMALHFPVHVAAATSHFVLAFAAGEATLVHAARGVIGWNETLARGALLAAGAVPGAQAGAWLARRLPGHAIMRGLAVGLVLVAVRLLLLGAS
ncbi:MAG: sulfite exporter TauE/SafE family protein [Chloroflexota bacterium]|nr:sulfite exporter TauE/SafE family protein [Dehalococcoidia bacterium]MDW8045737.1 sulfite exporter TauE/SafE family protein [Chloroflexota bacterium]